MSRAFDEQDPDLQANDDPADGGAAESDVATPATPFAPIAPFGDAKPWAGSALGRPDAGGDDTPPAGDEPPSD